MKKIILFLLIVFLIGNVYACEEGQININTASVEELDGLVGIGSVKAEGIINSRVFDSIDDLIEVYGIGEATLNHIKEQGLACVEKKEDSGRREIDEEEMQNIIGVSNTMKHITASAINLGGKSIKSGENLEDSKSWVLWGFVGFCILLGFLWMIKIRKSRYEKNEFE